MRSKARGFTLIEMMVVMAIMGLIVSVVTLSGGSLSAVFGDDRAGSAEALADELSLLMATASAEAILSGEPVALAFALSTAREEEGVTVSWLRYTRTADGPVRSRQAVWQSVSENTGLRDLHVPSAINSELSIEGEMVNMRALADSTGIPVLVFYPTGEMTGFNWSLLQHEQAVILTNDATGQIERRLP